MVAWRISIISGSAKYSSIHHPLNRPNLYDEYAAYAICRRLRSTSNLNRLLRLFSALATHGLGLAQEYRFIVEAVEALSDCTEIVISGICETGIDQKNKIFYIATDDFEVARKNLNSITNLGQTAMRSVKDATIYNILAQKIGKPEIPVKIGRSPLRKILTAAAQNEAPLTEDQQEEMISVVAKSARTIAETNPDKLTKLQSDIELVTLEHLIARYEEMISQRLKEQNWQVFFTENAVHR